MHFASKNLLLCLLEEINVDPKKKCAEVGKAEINAVSEALCNLPIHATGVFAAQAMVTAGGVSLKEVDGKTMQSKIVPNLFFCGEVLDIDGFTGGFNLQNCWSTGYICGKNI